MSNQSSPLDALCEHLRECHHPRITAIAVVPEIATLIADVLKAADRSLSGADSDFVDLDIAVGTLKAALESDRR